MGSETNHNELWAVRLLIVIPMLVLLIYVLSILNQPELISSTLQLYGLFGVLVTIGIVLVFASQITIPWTSTKENHAEYFIEELEEQERVYVIPTTCPRCKTAIELHRVRWEDEYTPLC